MRNYFLLIGVLISFQAYSQIELGTWRTAAGNTDYHHFVRTGGGAAVYINQASTNSLHPILRLSSHTVAANQSVRFTVENNGYVGIGTMNPSQQLSLSDGQIFLGNSSVNKIESGRIRFSEFEESYQGAFIHYNGAANVLNIGVHDANDQSTSSDFNSISILRSNGNVGVGTSPSVKFDVYNETLEESFKLTTGTDGRVLTLRGETINFKRAGSNYIAASSSSGALNFSTGGSDI